jgi:hypothetical protein
VAQDPIEAGPELCRIELENEFVRVIRCTVGPGGLHPMHVHPRSVVIGLTPSRLRLHFPNSDPVETEAPAGSVQWTDGTTHEPENIGETPFEAIVVELKDRSGHQPHRTP